MGVIVEDIRVEHEFLGNVTKTNYLLGNVGDKITIETDVRVEEVFVTSATEDDDRILLAPQPFRVNVADTKDVIYVELPGVFANYRVGDNFQWFNGTSFPAQRTVYEKISDQAIRVHPLGGSPGDDDFSNLGVDEDVTLAVNSYLFLTTNLTSVNYRWNFAGNSGDESYLNQIDDQLNQAKAPFVDNTDLATQRNLVFNTPVTNNYGSAYVKGNGSTTTSQKFTIVHETVITPFFLVGQVFDLIDNIKPDYLDADESFKYIVSVDVGRTENDPNFFQTINITALNGNVGWFNETFNGGGTNYSVDSVVYKRLDTSVIDSVELTDAEQTVEIVIKNTIDTPFSDGNTEFSLNFSVAPTDEDEYINNGQTVIENFYFDRATNIAKAIPTNVAGDNLGTPSQIFTEVNALYVSNSEIKITAKIDLESAAILDITSRDIQYFFWVAVQDHTLDTEDSDRVSLIADVQPFYIDYTDDGLLTITQKFMSHPESDFDLEGVETPTVRPEDDLVGYSQLIIDRLDREDDDITIDSAKVEVFAKKTDGSEFVFEDFTQSFSGSDVVGDTQYISTSSNRVFNMPDNDPKKVISVNRRIDLDTADLRYYEIKYPFLVRWEYWEALSSVSGDFFDTNNPNNGKNNDWVVFDNADWDLYYRTTAVVNKNGNIQLYKKDSVLASYDYLGDEDWINEEIKSYDVGTGLEITGGGNKLLKGNTRIEATKEYVGSGTLTVSDVAWVLRIETFEIGGSSDIRFLSSVYDWSELSWFKGLDVTNKVLKSKVGNVFKAEALIDFSKLPGDTKFSISARVYDKTLLNCPANALLEDVTLDCLLEDVTGDAMLED